MALNQNEIKLLAEKIIRIYKQRGLQLTKEDEKNIINLIHQNLHILQHQHPAVVCRLICAVILLQVAAKHNPQLAFLQHGLIELATTPIKDLTPSQQQAIKRCLAEEYKLLQQIMTLELLPPEIIKEMEERLNLTAQDIKDPENVEEPIQVMFFLDVGEQEIVAFSGKPSVSMLSPPISALDITDPSAPVVNVDYEMHKKGAHRITEDSQQKQEMSQATAAAEADTTLEQDTTKDTTKSHLPRPLPKGHPGH